MPKPHGRHPQQRLTARTVRTAKPGRHADGNGLYLVVADSGAKSWLLRTVVRGKRCDLGLGSNLTTSLADARTAAAQLRGLARKGEDVLAARRASRVIVPTFEAATRTVHAEQAPGFRNTKHAAQWLSSLETYAFPVFGSRPVHQVDTSHVLEALTPIWLTKRETARRVKQRLKVVFDWAKASGFRTGDNPIDGITKVLPKVRVRKQKHPALPYGKVPAFLTTLRRASTARAIKLGFEFLTLTAARTNEVVGAQWSEIDRRAKTWTVPAARMKAAREHDVPLSARCLTILDEAAKLRSGGRYIFPGRGVGAPLSQMAFLMLLRRLKRRDFVPHGMRSSFRTWAAERTNFPRDVVEAALAHRVAKDETEAAYYRTTLFEQRRELMATWEKFATSKPADVVSLRA